MPGEQDSQNYRYELLNDLQNKIFLFQNLFDNCRILKKENKEITHKIKQRAFSDRVLHYDNLVDQ